MDALPLLLVLLLLVVVLSRADGRFDRRVLGASIVAVTGVLVVTSVPELPYSVRLAVSVVGLASLVVVALGVLYDRYWTRTGLTG